MVKDFDKVLAGQARNTERFFRSSVVSTMANLESVLLTNLLKRSQGYVAMY